jgi:hypothetical protein
MKTTILLAAILTTLPGCAVVRFCDNHPVACSTAAAIVVSGTVAAYEGHRIQKSLDAAAAQGQQSQP